MTFHPDNYTKAIDMMIRVDEIQTALWMIDNMPGGPNPTAREMKRSIFRQLMSITDYALDKDEIEEGEQKVDFTTDAFTFPRYDIAKKWVEDCQASGYPPHIHEFGPASYWLPQGLLDSNLKFTYSASSVHTIAYVNALKKYKEIWRDKPHAAQSKAFVCFEVLEHLWSPGDIYHVFVKSGIEYDRIFLSTPYGCFLGGSVEDWRSRPLGHIRTYTPDEFYSFACYYWPEYKWEIVKHDSMVLIGTRNV